MRNTHLGFLAGFALVAAGCSGHQSIAPAPAQLQSVTQGSLPLARSAIPDARPTRCPAADYTCVKHVVVIIQENRSFNNLFMGFPRAETQSFGMAGPVLVPLEERGIEGTTKDISHCFEDATNAWDDGLMDGFDRERGESFPVTHCPSILPQIGTSGTRNPYVYVPNDAPNYVNEAGPYWKMAKEYILADHYFPTDFGPSFTAHQYLVASTTDYKPDLAIVNYPGIPDLFGGERVSSVTSWSCDSPGVLRTPLLDVHRTITYLPGPFSCFHSYRTIADSLDVRGIGWRYYTPTTGNFPTSDYIWNPFSAIYAVRHGPDWANMISPETNVLNDAANGQLKGVTWVVPDGKFSDHSGGFATDKGPSWVAAVVNAIGTGPQWSSTAIIVLWDDWGGFYDPVPPPQMDFRGLGIRTPLIIISPYAKRGEVTKTLFEPGSILKFVETVFQLPPIGGSCAIPVFGSGYTDCRANVLDGFDFHQKPREFTLIKAKYPPSTFTNAAGPAIPPDNE